jgi:NADH-quinone oxidoreductase subunit H
MRVGPPFLQPFYDIVKYFVKETCVPEGSPKLLFLSAPLIGFGAVTVASLILWRSMLSPERAFLGDLIVVLYLLTMPAVSVILGAFASRNPLASIGGSREMKLVMAYELPFVLCVLVPVIKTHSIRLGEIATAHPAVASVSGVVALIVAILCMQAKTTQVPFDMGEAETELTGGAYIEYSGPALGMFKLTRAMMQFTVPMFLVAVFCGGLSIGAGPIGIVYGALKYIGLVVIMVLIRNTAPRVRIDQAVRFFWGPMTVLAIVAAGLALIGR